MIKVSIVILNWNRPKDTLDCLRSIRKCRIPNAKCQIIVVDNNSIDNSVTRIKKQLVKIKNEDSISSEIIENTENLGFAEGNNVGIRHALNHGADYILLLNNDTVVDKNLITEFITAAKTDPKAFLKLTLVDADGKPTGPPTAKGQGKDTRLKAFEKRELNAGLVVKRHLLLGHPSRG